MHRALGRLGLDPDHVIVDAFPLDAASRFASRQTAVIRADATCLAVAAASICAKVARDRLMRQLSRRFPDFAFDRNKGYGTARHRAALQALGPIALHRHSFAPVQQAHAARYLAARELRRRNYRIIDRNVRVGRGELDIVASDRDATVFVEVKTRRDQAFGGARAALTPTKGRQLARLAQTYLRQHPNRAGAYRIDVVAIDVDPTGDYTLDVIPNAVQQ